MNMENVMYYKRATDQIDECVKSIYDYQKSLPDKIGWLYVSADASEILYRDKQALYPVHIWAAINCHDDWSNPVVLEVIINKNVLNKLVCFQQAVSKVLDLTRLLPQDQLDAMKEPDMGIIVQAEFSGNSSTYKAESVQYEGDHAWYSGVIQHFLSEAGW